MLTDPLEQILWETVGYLASYERRQEAFAALKERTGLTPERIASTSPEVLEEICRIGGIYPEVRAERLQTIAQIVLHEYGGDLSSVLNMPTKQALKALCRFPSIGMPGAEKILLFAGVYPVLALDSNGLRVLTRVGYGEESTDYSRTYRSVRNAVAGTYPNDCTWLIRANMLLRRHGQTICRRSSPECG